MIRVAEHVERTDTGRHRRGNEDAYVARAPLFAVADGMGGAQAGEVASRAAIDVFARGVPEGAGSVEERLVGMVQEANEHIHEMSLADEEHAGMGTTLTSAYVGEHDVTIVHVGDSRAYLLREGEVARVTTDHSLVEELVRQGRLTPQEAEDHPQRSIITRALGPALDLDADSHTIPARDGDVYLLCSDGLTDMVSEVHVAEVLRAGGTLQAIARELVDRANAAGGRDNITVVLFRLEAVGPPDPGDDEATRAGAAALRVEDVRRALDQGPATEPAAARPTAAQVRRPQPPRGTGIPAPRRRRRLHAGWVISGLLVVMLLAAGYLASQAVYFVGTGNDGFVRIYRGVPLNLPAGLDLYQPVYVSGVSAAQLSASQARTITGHRLRARSDADDLVRQLETGRLGSR